jgi:serine/threonine protein kinase
MYGEENTEDIPADGQGRKGHYSDELKDLVKKLLVRNPEQRLGYAVNYTDDYKMILQHKAFEKLTKENDGSPNDPGITFIKPDLYNFNQDFDKLKKEKDDVLAIKEDDNINASQENKFADLFPKDETESTVQGSTDGT